MSLFDEEEEIFFNEKVKEVIETNKSITLIQIEHLDELKSRLMKEFDLDILENSANTIGITSYQDAKHVLSMALQARKLKKAVEQSKLEVMRPILDHQSAVNKIIKRFKDKLNLIEESLQNKVESWMKQQTEDEIIVREIKVEDGTISMKKYWTFEIENPHLIPKAYCTIDPIIIKDSIESGVRNIPGVKIFEAEETTMRVKN